MARVAAPGGKVALQVWGSLASQPAYGPLVEVAARHAGPEAVGLLSAYWVLGDLDLGRVAGRGGRAAGHLDADAHGTARFDSIDELVRTEVESTPPGRSDQRAGLPPDPEGRPRGAGAVRNRRERRRRPSWDT